MYVKQETLRSPETHAWLMRTGKWTIVNMLEDGNDLAILSSSITIRWFYTARL